MTLERRRNNVSQIVSFLIAATFGSNDSPIYLFYLTYYYHNVYHEIVLKANISVDSSFELCYNFFSLKKGRFKNGVVVTLKENPKPFFKGNIWKYMEKYGNILKCMAPKLNFNI